MNELLECLKNLTGECDLFLTVTYVGDGYMFYLGHYNNITDCMTHSSETISSVLIPDILKSSGLVPIVVKLFEDIKKKEIEDERLD